jgi:APA family basic amino acid/polyamine antiporter
LASFESVRPRDEFSVAFSTRARRDPPISQATGDVATDASSDHQLRREITSWGSFTWGYADVGADIYVALGLVMATAEGLANIAFLFAGLVYVTVGLAYTELSAAYPLAGGGQFFVLRGLGDFWAFIAGWAVLLDFTVDITLFAFSSAGYIDHFFPQAASAPWIDLEAAGLIVFLYAVNVAGVKESTRLNAVAALVDIISETTLIFIGFVIAFNPTMWANQVTYSLHHFDLGNLALGSSLAIISFVGLESIAQAAQETIRPATVMPRTSIALILTILAYAMALSVLTMGVLQWNTFDPTHACVSNYHHLVQGACSIRGVHQTAPVPWLADNIPIVGIFIAPLVSVLGAMLLLISSNAGVFGSSRIAYSMAYYDQLPSLFSRVAKSRRTPVVALTFFCSLALVLLLFAALQPHTLATLGDLYAFGAATSYSLVFFSALRLRFSDPYTPRPFKMPWNITIHAKGRPVEVSIVNILGIFGIVGILVMVIFTHPIGRIAGPVWIAIGLVMYVLYRRSKKLPFPGSVERDWPSMQLAVYRESGEGELADEYEENLRYARRSPQKP